MPTTVHPPPPPGIATDYGVRLRSGSALLPLSRERKRLVPVIVWKRSGMDHFVISQLAGFVIGVMTGLVAPAALRWSRVFRASIGNRRRFARELESFDSRSRGYHPINRWSPSRRLTPDSLVTREVVPDTPQSWCDRAQLVAISAEVVDRGGPSCYLVGYDIDHRESRSGQKFTVRLARSDFGDYVAVTRYFERYPDALAAVKNRALEDGINGLVECAPPSVIGMHVNVVSADGRFLVIQRSGAVAENQNEWMVGPGETMTASDSAIPGTREDFFELARRALLEEVGLRPEDYGAIHISWIGMYLDRASPLVIGHVYSRLESDAITDRIRHSHGFFEAAGWEWPKLNRAMVSALFAEMSGPQGQRSWHAGAPLVLQELWRYRELLEFD